jgi:hypothetical protein
MASQNFPSILISFPTWKKIVAEVAFWANHGQQQQGHPYEATFYPLGTVQLRQPAMVGPFTPIRLSNVSEILLDEVFLPPRQFTQYTSTSAQFSNLAASELTQDFQQAMQLALARRAQLLFLGPGHSHPFAVDNTWPSYTDIHGHMLPYRQQNEELLGLEFSLALIVVQRAFGRQAGFPISKATEPYRADPTTWQACAFAIDETRQLQALGKARIVSDNHPQMRQARRRSFFQTRQGRRWEKQQQAALGSKLLEHARWPGGWTTFLIQQTPTAAQLLSFSPYFPQVAPLQQTVQLQQRKISSINAPDTPSPSNYQYYQLLTLKNSVNTLTTPGS